jgi:hypothetical protein
MQLKLFYMKAILQKPFFRKYGKKALVIYFCWCLVKGLAFLILGFKFFG